MINIKLEEISFQALKIPTGWTVSWNQFYDVEPNANLKIDGLPDGDIWELFVQDLLQLKHYEQNFILDLGWIPEADPNGNYELSIIKDEDWSYPIETYKSKNKDEVVQLINRLLLKYSQKQ